MLDLVQLGVPVRVGGLLPGPGPLEGDLPGVQDLPQPFASDPDPPRGQVRCQLAQAPVGERQVQFLWACGGRRDDDLDVLVPAATSSQAINQPVNVGGHRTSAANVTGRAGQGQAGTKRKDHPPRPGTSTHATRPRPRPPGTETATAGRWPTHPPPARTARARRRLLPRPDGSSRRSPFQQRPNDRRGAKPTIQTPPSPSPYPVSAPPTSRPPPGWPPASGGQPNPIFTPACVASPAGDIRTSPTCPARRSVAMPVRAWSRSSRAAVPTWWVKTSKRPREGEDSERRAVACAAEEQAPCAQHPRCGCRRRSRRRGNHRDDSVAAQCHLELTGNRGGRQGCERRESRAGSGEVGLCCPQRRAEPGRPRR